MKVGHGGGVLLVVGVGFLDGFGLSVCRFSGWLCWLVVVMSIGVEFHGVTIFRGKVSGG